MKDDDFKMLMGFASKQTDGLTDICECRVAFATENRILIFPEFSDNYINYLLKEIQDFLHKQLFQGK